MKTLSQKEFIDHIEMMHANLKNSWAADQRVQCLKIAIQCSKLLLENSVPGFYPSQFVLVTSILDTFGDLVYNRLLEISDVSGRVWCRYALL